MKAEHGLWRCVLVDGSVSLQGLPWSALEGLAHAGSLLKIYIAGGNSPGKRASRWLLWLEEWGRQKKKPGDTFLGKGARQALRIREPMGYLHRNWDLCPWSCQCRSKPGLDEMIVTTIHTFAWLLHGHLLHITGGKYWAGRSQGNKIDSIFKELSDQSEKERLYF